MSRCDKKAKVGTQESVTYYAYAVDLAFAIMVWKCQGGTFEYIIALPEHSPGSPALTFEKLYVMFTRVKEATHFQCLPLSPIHDKCNQKSLPQNGKWTLTNMDTGDLGHPLLQHFLNPKFQRLLCKNKHQNK
jgi:hypothetical protein